MSRSRAFDDLGGHAPSTSTRSTATNVVDLNARRRSKAAADLPVVKAPPMNARAAIAACRQATARARDQVARPDRRATS